MPSSEPRKSHAGVPALVLPAFPNLSTRHMKFPIHDLHDYCTKLTVAPQGFVSIPIEEICRVSGVEPLGTPGPLFCVQYYQVVGFYLFIREPIGDFPPRCRRGGRCPNSGTENCKPSYVQVGNGLENKPLFREV